MTHGYDWSARGMTAQHIANAGGSVVFRYLSGPNALTRHEVDSFHELGIAVCPIYETNADQAEHPERGAGDAREAERLLDALGAPDSVAIYYTDDHKDNDASQELGYMAGVVGAMRRPRCGLYGNDITLDAVRSTYPQVAYGWGVGTWGFGEGPGRLPPVPDLAVAQTLQLANTHEPEIPDAPVAYDTNLIYADDIGAWLPPGSSTVRGADMIRRLTEDVPDIAAKGTLWIAQPQRWERVDAASPGVPIQDIDGATFKTIRDDQDALRNFVANPPVGTSGGGLTAAEVVAILNGTKLHHA